LLGAARRGASLARSFNKKARSSERAFNLNLFYLNEVLNLEDHATDARIVYLLNRTADLAKTKSLQGATLIVLIADGALYLGDAQLLCVSHF
jgi:hypothetical protein